MISLRSLLFRLKRLEQKSANASIHGPPVERMSLQDIQAEMIEGSIGLLESPHREEAVGWLRQVATTGLTDDLRKRALEALTAAQLDISEAHA